VSFVFNLTRQPEAPRPLKSDLGTRNWSEPEGMRPGRGFWLGKTAAPGRSPPQGERSPASLDNGRIAPESSALVISGGFRHISRRHRGMVK